MFECLEKMFAGLLAILVKHTRSSYTNLSCTGVANDRVCRTETSVETALAPTRVPDGRRSVKESTVSLPSSTPRLQEELIHEQG